MKIYNIDHLSFYTKRPEACLHFYSDILGCLTEYKNAELQIRCGQHTLIAYTDDARPLQTPLRYTASGSQNFCLRAEGNPDFLLNYLRSQGVHITENKVELCDDGALGDIHSIYMLDPDGNLVEIAIYHPDAVPFQITGLDHFVIIADDILETMQFYHDVLGITGYLNGARKKSDMHGALLTGNQRVNIHHQKPLYKPHIPYAAVGSVDCTITVDEMFYQRLLSLFAKSNSCDDMLIGQKSVSNQIVRDPNGNLLRFVCEK